MQDSKDAFFKVEKVPLNLNQLDPSGVNGAFDQMMAAKKEAKELTSGKKNSHNKFKLSKE